jgi:hypothetical protein
MKIGRFSLVAIDCPDPVSLAEFYAGVTGWEIASVDDEWVELSSDGGATIAFQLAPGHRSPAWPGDEHPQQMHLDFDVTDLDEGEAAVVALGARKTEVQPSDEFRVFLDPAGHPFCLVLSD